MQFKPKSTSCCAWVHGQVKKELEYFEQVMAIPDFSNNFPMIIVKQFEIDLNVR